MVLWLWDKSRFVAQLQFTADVAKGSIPNQASFNPYNTFQEAQASILVLGHNCFKNYKMMDAGNFVLRNAQLTKKDPHMYSLNYTCHAWVSDYLLVCTDRGEILFCDQNCDFKFMLIDSPVNALQKPFKIQNILALKGDDFIIANDKGDFCHYEATGELRNPFKMFKGNLPVAVDMDENARWNNHLEG